MVFQTQCSNGATGFGRKKRSILSGSDSNRLFEISLTTFIKVEDDSNEAGTENENRTYCLVEEI